jgi:demethylmenaquinone methyltransferase/2-methoxy-6-polyprenyl-1,4-benzoquinol methylase
MESRLQQPTPAYFRYTIALISHFPNFDLPFILRLRRKAVDSLQLPQGARVLDVGCGPGGTFPYLVRAVGPTGEVVGVEISPEVASTARKRVQVNGWGNVSVVEGDARSVRLSGTFDGMVMFGAPDIYASPAALANLMPYLNDQARLVAFGIKLTSRRGGSLLNPLLKTLMRLSFDSTPELNYEPGSPMKAYAPDLEVHEYPCGCFFMAFGPLSRRPPAPNLEKLDAQPTNPIERVEHAFRRAVEAPHDGRL